MATGWGVPHSKSADGVSLVGTSDQDIRRITGGLFTEGVISGASVKTSTSALSYTIDPGVINLWFAGSASAKECVLIPVSGVTVSTSAGPGSGSRTDYVWVRQAPSSTNITTGSQITYGVSTTNPRNLANPGEYFVLGTFTVPAGMTKTSSASPVQGQVYAVPYGSTGLLLSIVDTFDDLVSKRAGKVATNSGKFTLATDQLVEFRCGVTVEHDDPAKPNDFVFDGLDVGLSINGIARSSWRAGPVHVWHATHEWTYITTLPAGTHTVEFTRTELRNSGTLRLRYSANGIPGSYCHVKSLGVVA